MRGKGAKKYRLRQTRRHQEGSGVTERRWVASRGKEDRGAQREGTYKQGGVHS